MVRKVQYNAQRNLNSLIIIMLRYFGTYLLVTLDWMMISPPSAEARFSPAINIGLGLNEGTFLRPLIIFSPQQLAGYPTANAVRVCHDDTEGSAVVS